MLLQNGADVNAVDDSKWTALHLAASGGYVDVAKVLIQNGADVNAVDDRKSTVLHFAALEGQVDVVKVLIQNGADVEAMNLDHQTPFNVVVLTSMNARGYNFKGFMNTLLFLFCIGRARVSQNFRQMSSPRRFGRYNIFPLLIHLRSLRREDDKKCRVFTQDEGKFLCNLAFVLANKCPGFGKKMFYSVLQFMSYGGCFMSSVFCLGDFYPQSVRFRDQ